METRDFIAVLAVLVAFFIGVANYTHNRRLHHEGQIKDRKKTIEDSLNDFYYPLMGYLNVSQAFFKIYSAGKPKEFRTLTYLLDPGQLYQSDKGPVKVELTKSDITILKDVLRIGVRIEKLVMEKCGFVNDRTLLYEYVPSQDYTDIDPEVVRGQGLLAITVTHLRLMRLAFHKSLQGQIERYKNFVYPRQLNKIVYDKIRILEAERDWLTTLDPTSLDPNWSIVYDAYKQR